jgi:hypothetical protein
MSSLHRMIIQSFSDKQEPNKIGHYIKRTEIQLHGAVPILMLEMYVLTVANKQTHAKPFQRLLPVGWGFG